MSENPAINFHGWSDQAASFDRLAGVLREKFRDLCCNFLCAKRKVEDLFNVQKLKQRRVGYCGHREVTLSKADVLKEFIPHLTLLIEIVLKHERMDLLFVRNGE